LLVGEAIWGSQEDRNHEAVMEKFTEISSEIKEVSDQIEETAAEIKAAISRDTYTEIVSDLQTVGMHYDEYLVYRSHSLTEKLKNAYNGDEGFSYDLVHLVNNIGDYFHDFQEANMGSCHNLYKYRSYVSALMVKGLLGAAVGCTLFMKDAERTLENGGLNLEEDCLMTTERQAILNVENAMVDKLKKCNEDVWVKRWTEKFIDSELQATMSKQQMAQGTKDFIDDTFPNFNYWIIVEPGRGGWNRLERHAWTYFPSSDILTQKGEKYIVVYLRSEPQTCPGYDTFVENQECGDLSELECSNQQAKKMVLKYQEKYPGCICGASYWYDNSNVKREFTAGWKWPSIRKGINGIQESKLCFRWKPTGVGVRYININIDVFCL